LVRALALIFYPAQHFDLADHIVVFDKDGRIAEQGSYDHLRSQGGYISKILLRGGGWSDESTPRALENGKAALSNGPSMDVTDLTRKTGDLAVYGMDAL
jgi:ATP-binding cassette subfamily C (CFTR/MRP) protein 1